MVFSEIGDRNVRAYGSILDYEWLERKKIKFVQLVLLLMVIITNTGLYGAIPVVIFTSVFWLIPAQNVNLYGIGMI